MTKDDVMMLTLRHMLSHDVTENNQADWPTSYHKTAVTFS